MQSSLLGIVSALLAFGAPAIASSQTIIDWAKARGVEGTTVFEDGDALAGEPRFTFRQRERGLALFGVSAGRDRWRSPEEHRLGYDLRMDGELGLAVEGFEPKPFQWGTTSRVGLRFSLGGGSGSAHSELAGEIASGALFTLDRAGSGVVARVSGAAFAVLEPGADAMVATIGVPFGFGFHRGSYHGEILLLPALGWMTVVEQNQSRGTGPLFGGAVARFGAEHAWLEGTVLHSVLDAEADASRLSVCSTLDHWFLCADGLWIHVRDIVDEDPGGFARVGLRLGLASLATRVHDRGDGQPH
ncbi:MAG: hypothetical protein QM784_03390 [Polyangiaceae bacterium]